MIKTIRRSDCDHSKLICFSYAGGNASEYYAWREYLDPGIELAVVNLKGRGARFKEPCTSEMSEVVEEIVESLVKSYHLPFSFFGHSLGSLVAYECAHELATRSVLAQPELLFLSGRKAPHLPLNRRKFYDLADDELLGEITQLGSANTHLLMSSEMAQLALPILRADFRLNDDYIFSERDLLNIPFTVFGGTDDPAASESELRAWSQHTSSSAEYHQFEGGHFFIEKHISSIAQTISQVMLKQSQPLPLDSVSIH